MLTEVLAAHLGLLAIVLIDDRPSRRALVAAGACFGGAICLRYQYGPALLAAALCQLGVRPARWRPLLVGGLVVLLPIGGILDYATWGSPFQSIWLNFTQNSLHGVSAAMGTEPAGFHLAYLATTLFPWPIFVVLIFVGAARAPALAAAAAVTVALHAAVPHKEVRFIYLAIAIAPILAGLGAAAILRALADRRGQGVVTWGTALLLLCGTGLSWHMATATPLAVRWQFERANVEPFLAAHREPALCGLAVKDIPFYMGAGYAYLHRSVPIRLSGLRCSAGAAGSDVSMRLDIVLQGQSVPQFPAGRLDGAVSRYNHMIAEPGHEPVGFSPVGCFNDSTRGGRPPLCLFRREGGCGG